jgi:hypothetical protein
VIHSLAALPLLHTLACSNRGDPVTDPPEAPSPMPVPDRVDSLGSEGHLLSHPRTLVHHTWYLSLLLCFVLFCFLR